MVLILSWRFEFLHHALVSFSVLLSIYCLIAERLVGSSLRRNRGSEFMTLEPYSAASFPSKLVATVDLPAVLIRIWRWLTGTGV